MAASDGLRYAEWRVWKSFHPSTADVPAHQSTPSLTVSICSGVLVPVDPKHQKLRRERIKAAGGTHSKTDVSLIRAAQDDRCNYCSVPLHGGGDRDHVIPLAKRGLNGKENIQLLCRSCNLIKGNTLPNRLFEPIGLTIGWRTKDWLDGYRHGFLPQPNSRPPAEVRAERNYPRGAQLR